MKEVQIVKHIIFHFEYFSQRVPLSVYLTSSLFEILTNSPTGQVSNSTIESLCSLCFMLVLFLNWIVSWNWTHFSADCVLSDASSSFTNLFFLLDQFSALCILVSNHISISIQFLHLNALLHLNASAFHWQWCMLRVNVCKS